VLRVLLCALAAVWGAAAGLLVRPLVQGGLGGACVGTPAAAGWPAGPTLCSRLRPGPLRPPPLPLLPGAV
jgi:hypothetical protein